MTSPEYINHRVAALLNKLHIGQFTKSRARQCNDNALVEGKNGAVIRHYLGYVRNPVKVITRSTLKVITDSTVSDHPPERSDAGNPRLA